MIRDLFSLGEQPYSDDDAEWDAFVATHPQGSLLQTTSWARLKNRFNWAARRVWLRKEGQLVAGAQILFRSAYWGMVKIAYIPHGPLVDWEDNEQVDVLFNQIDQAVYQNRAGLLKLEPFVWRDAMPPARWQALCERVGLRPDADTIQPPRTMIIDVDRTADAILQSMKQKTRYNIRLAERKGVVVREGDAADFGTFAQLMASTGTRNTFGVHAPQYYAVAYQEFSARNEAALLLAEYEGRPLAGAMIFRNGSRASYLYGGSNDEERQRMPSYAVQWAAIQWAQRQGCKEYDLWGVPDEEPDALEAGFQERQDGLWPVYRFKRGFQGEIRRTVGTADRVYSKLFYRLYQRRRGGGL